MATIKDIQNHPVYKRVLEDSFGGIMYNVANKYDATEVLEMWNSLTPADKELAGGIMKGAINFLEEQGK